MIKRRLGERRPWFIRFHRTINCRDREADRSSRQIFHDLGADLLPAAHVQLEFRPNGPSRPHRHLSPLRGDSIRTTLPSMRHMVVIVPELTGYASIRYVAVSLPYAAQLIDGVKYMLPQDVKAPEGGTEKRRQRAPRAPSMRTLVRWAQKCDSAEQLGQRLKRRYDRQLQRQGLAPPGNARAEAELANMLGDPP